MLSITINLGHWNQEGLIFLAFKMILKVSVSGNFTLSFALGNCSHVVGLCVSAEDNSKAARPQCGQ